VAADFRRAFVAGPDPALSAAAAAALSPMPSDGVPPGEPGRGPLSRTPSTTAISAGGAAGGALPQRGPSTRTMTVTGDEAELGQPTPAPAPTAVPPSLGGDAGGSGGGGVTDGGQVGLGRCGGAGRGSVVGWRGRQSQGALCLGA
jgi:hypothetical protein